ncbi:methyl-accepting chemotaxis protein [Peribacillus sp. SCS-26]|uniref:methyl-accepting chemotaxis protein n=1 Tax=Paraperibacillus marinus TaxID=3115295 RepID=UPI003906C9F1
MFKKIQSKIMLTVSLLLAVTLMGVSALTYFQTKNEMSISIDSSSKALVHDLKNQTDLYLNLYRSSVERYSHDNRVITYLKEVKKNEKKGLDTYWPLVNKDFENFMNLNKNVAVIYVGAETKQFKTTPVIELPADFDPTGRPWYTAAVSSKELSLWTEPYKDASSGEYVVTVVQPVLDPDSKEVLGVVGLDLSLAGLKKMINQTEVGYKGFSFLLDSKGMALAHPKESGKDQSKKPYYSGVSRQNSGIAEYDDKNTERKMYFQTLEQTGWKIGMVYDTDQLFAGAKEIRDIILLVASVAVLIGLVITYFLARSIAKPITNLKDQVQFVAQGDLTVNVFTKSKDEIGQLTTHFNQMVESMRKLITSVEKSVESVNDSAVSLTAVAEETIAASEEVSNAIGEVAAGATQQAQDSVETNSRALSLSSQIERVNENVEQMTDLSMAAEQTNKKGMAQMESLRQRTGESNEVILHAGDVISGLAQQVKEIEQVIHTITEISDQTNLLALNASIEAARAGDSGRGFAVVADEVRKLAEQSAKAASQVKQTITSIEKETNVVVREMEQTIAISKLQNEAVNEAEIAFGEISATIHDIVSSINYIKSDIENINILKNEVVTSIDSIASVAGQSAAASEQVSASTEEQVRALGTISHSAIELTEASSNLTDMIRHFKL